MINLNDFKQSLNAQPLAIFGLGASGLATLEALRAHDIEVIAWDDNDSARKKAADLGAKVMELTQEILKTCSSLILSPGVPLTHPEPHDVVKAAHAGNTEIIGDVEIFTRALNADKQAHKIVAITGTNGKSTTTALLTHVLQECGRSVQMGGNIGVPILKLSAEKPETIFVLEVSSYQIDLSPNLKPDIGLLLNITPDHIDRHGSFENYRAIKHRMIENSAVKIHAETLDHSPIKGHHFETLRGAHNAQNNIAVLEICKHLGIDQSQAIEAVKNFAGLAHRQYLVRTIGNVQYINDSKATNAEATSKALSSYKNIYWILGGQAKDGGLSGLEDYYKDVKAAYLIGEATDSFADQLKNQNVSYLKYDTLDIAIAEAHKAAQANGEPATILLSPACASWDQFKSFEHRGDTFIEIVEGL